MFNSTTIKTTKANSLSEAKSVEEALEIARAGYKIDEEQLFTRNAWGEMKPVSSHKATVRKDTGSALGIVSSRYKIVQTVDAFKPLDVFLQNGFCAVDEVTIYRGGKRISITASIKDAQADVVPGDHVSGRFGFATSHDGSLSWQGFEEQWRQVCSNGMMGWKKEAVLRMRHTKSLEGNIDALADVMAKAHGDFQGAIEQYRNLASKPLGVTAVHDYFEEVLRLDVRKKTNGKNLANPEKEGERQMTQLLEHFDSQPGAQYGRGTYWQAFNAVTYWVDHVRGKDATSRLDSARFGEGARIKSRALESALRA